MLDLVGTTELAQMLGVKRCHACRLLRGMPGRMMVNGGWCVEREAVEELIDRREAEKRGKEKRRRGIPFTDGGEREIPASG